MKFTTLIDAVVRQTTVLIAQLATAAGVRAPLAHLANQVFLELVRELEAQGLGRKVVADMFGIALRSYQLKVRRLEESETDRSRTLWESVHDFVREYETVSRQRVLERFARDDEGQVRAILNDLVESGIVYRTGRGGGTVYRGASHEELGDAFALDPKARAAHFVWINIYRAGPVTRDALLAQLRLSPPELDGALAELAADRRVEQDADGAWRCETCFLPTGTAIGWEAAVFDHFQALVQALCIKLDQGAVRSLPSDVVGGSTWSFDIWPDHPYEDAVYGLLKRLRLDVSSLRAAVTEYNETAGRRADPHKVTFYLGQSVMVPAAGESSEEAE